MVSKWWFGCYIQISFKVNWINEHIHFLHRHQTMTTRVYSEMDIIYALLCSSLLERYDTIRYDTVRLLVYEVRFPHKDLFRKPNNVQCSVFLCFTPPYSVHLFSHMQRWIRPRNVIGFYSSHQFSFENCWHEIYECWWVYLTNYSWAQKQTNKQEIWNSQIKCVLNKSWNTKKQNKIKTKHEQAKLIFRW